jgi:hypothetical protein
LQQQGQQRLAMRAATAFEGTPSSASPSSSAIRHRAVQYIRDHLHEFLRPTLIVGR